MQRLFSILLLFLAVSLPISAFADDTLVPVEVMTAKTVYVQKGVTFRDKKDPTGNASYVDPVRDELNKWGRFKVVADPRDADVIFRIRVSDQTHREMVGSPNVTGSVTRGSVFTVLDVVDRSSGKILWSANQNWARSWNTKSATTGVVKKFRKHVEEQEKATVAAK